VLGTAQQQRMLPLNQQKRLALLKKLSCYPKKQKHNVVLFWRQPKRFDISPFLLPCKEPIVSQRIATTLGDKHLFLVDPFEALLSHRLSEISRETHQLPLCSCHQN
jgi:hypothetical protein